MFDIPYHPMVVHLPIALAIIIPILSLFLWGAIKCKKASAKSWGILVVLTALYLVSSLAAVKSGEFDEDLVEDKIGKKLVHEHEERGEKIPWVAGVLLIAYTVTYVTGRSKLSWTHKLCTVLSIAAVYPIILAGHSGGQLVYKHGAASAHTKDNGAINQNLDEGHEN
ncbi:MAG: hypothetical protein KDD33_00590 [Bdellovibrionales bacterium]|nr:hypothetical protein [Bdellovibrionales bacterium]